MYAAPVAAHPFGDGDYIPEQAFLHFPIVEVEHAQR